MRFSSSSSSSLASRLFASLSVALALVVFFACGRSSLEPETLNDGGIVVPGACSASSCPTGCCDANGTCRTGNDTRACGAAGGRCSDCVAQGFSVCTASRVCGRDDPSCGPLSCPNGCCSGESGRQRCLAGNEATACGIGGGTCNDCADQGRACDPSTRTCSQSSCNSTNCNGCCVGNQCLTGTSATSCGNRGQQCQNCASNNQACTAVAGGGGQCTGNATCGPLNCGGGCCFGTQCVAGSDDTACGKGGFACQNCQGQNPPRQCVPDGQQNERTCQLPQACGPGNCSGCCFNGACIQLNDTTKQRCGKGGQACQTCNGNNTCNAGTCGPPACPASCGAGGAVECCLQNIGICGAGSLDSQCGHSGNNCTQCGASQVCQNGVCQQKQCGDPGTCDTGCCSGNTCVAGNQDFACGAPGSGACNDCVNNPPGPGQTACNATSRQCVVPCSIASCPSGCCSGSVCLPGNTNAACGTAGAACAVCQGAFACNQATRLCSQ